MPGDAGFLPSTESFQNFNPKKLPADPLWPEIRFISLTDQSCDKCNFQCTWRDVAQFGGSRIGDFLQMRHVRWELDFSRHKFESSKYHGIRKSETWTRKITTMTQEQSTTGFSRKCPKSVHYFGTHDSKLHLSFCKQDVSLCPAHQSFCTWELVQIHKLSLHVHLPLSLPVWYPRVSVGGCSRSNRMKT